MAKRADEHVQLPYPNGWFAVAWSRDLHAGDVRPLHVLRRGAGAVPHALGPGARARRRSARTSARTSADGGRVMGETIRCPFHGWQYDGASGRLRRTSRTASASRRRRACAPGRCRRSNGMIFVWHHGEGKPPEWDFPALPEIGHPDWSEPRTLELRCRRTCRTRTRTTTTRCTSSSCTGCSRRRPREITYSDGRPPLSHGQHAASR